MKMVVLSRIYILCSLILLTSISTAYAQQPESTSDNIFQTRVRAADENTLVAGKTVISLWGLEGLGAAPVVQKLKARVALENAIGGQVVECEWKTRTKESYFAQCRSDGDIDLGLFMIQQGYAIVDRQMVYNTVFETPYVQAEAAAQDAGFGVWGEGIAMSSRGVGVGNNNSLMVIVGFSLFLAIVGAFGFIAMNIMRGFQKVIDAQNVHTDLLSEQRNLKDKERGIVAVMLESEIKSNMAKIQAYLVVYEELLGSLRNTEVEPKYKQVGDIVQQQPALDRAVFDRNTDKLEMLGQDLSSTLVHFYARIKSEAEYKNLEPDMTLDEAIAAVEKVLENARRLNQLSGQILDHFTSYSFGDVLEVD